MPVSVIRFHVPTFTSLLRMNGGRLPHKPGAMALWFYYLQAQRNWENEKDPIVYEGDRDPTYNYKQLYTSIATLYGVSPEEMNGYWPIIDEQALILGLPLLSQKLRFQGIRVS